ncbi:hypothetical protein FB567DRAFT_551017 [Paraphoma chrysanthemicola]|uniref:CFEM domain-containing protein n=1 Tax=Paraphoma chrysanthemicola TaxID=798071 RepID=A0A8K0VXP8_9PLEO|nr:hypothetical protein FB567DRAFT_551017 [Paraphoma chrysanthemicola]
MRAFIRSLFLMLLTFCSNVFALQLDKRALTIADIPPCGLTCLLQTVPSAGCGLADIACQCSNQALVYSTAACMLSNCTMADSLGTAKVQADLCNLSHESRSTTILVAFTIVFTMICVFVALRIANKLLTKRVKSDDYVIVVTLLLGTAIYASAYSMVQNGFGKHLWDLQPGQLQAALKYFYVCWNLYVVTLSLVKASLIFLYLQIFQGHRFRIACYTVLAYIGLSALIIQFLTIFSCLPIESFWNRDIKGKCLNVTAIGYANSANAILQDLIILILPMPNLFRLKMKKWRKIVVAVMFAVGAFGCITTIIRLRSLLHFGISVDPTWDYTDVSIWTGAELASGIVCASLPAIRQLLIMIIPTRFISLIASRTRSRSTPMPAGGGSSSAQRKHKGHSVFPLPPISDYESKSLGTTTDTSSSSWTKSKRRASQDVERGYAHRQDPDRSSWLPLRHLFTSRSRSFQTSFWSAVDRSGSPPLPPTPSPPPKNSGYWNPSSRTELANATQKSSFDERIEMLRVPEATHQTPKHRSACEEEITALPRVGILPDAEYPRSGLLRGWRDAR